MKYRSSSVLILAVIAACIGCRSGNGMPVSGQVTLNGMPIPEGHISFEPTARTGTSHGALIKNGRFAIPKARGVPPGEYLVRIYSADETPTASLTPEEAAKAVPRVSKELIPPEYNVRSSQKVLVSKVGPNEFDFAIQVKG